MHCAQDEIMAKNIIGNTSIFFLIYRKVFLSCVISTVVSRLFVWRGHWACVLQNKTHFTFINVLNYLNYALASAKYLLSLEL